MLKVKEISKIKQLNNHMKYELEERVEKFGESIINLSKKVRVTSITKSIIEQLVRSGTSVGANYFEANGASTKKDFIAKYYIVKKEAKETKYWLSVIKDTDLLTKDTVEPYIEECHEILMIVSKIINNTKY